MLTIIKYGVQYNIPRSAIASIDAAYDGIRVILTDRTEISFQMSVSQQVKAIIPIVKTAVGHVTFNLDNAISGNYDGVLDITYALNNTPEQKVNTTATVPEAPKPPAPVTQPPKRPRGRPKKVDITKKK